MSRRFSNPWPHPEHRFRDVLRWKLGLGPKEPPSDAPDTPAEVVPWKRESIPASGWRVSWLGHASFLLEGCGRRLLVDPIFSRHCAPLPLPALQRLAPPPCTVAEIGPVDAVLLTHGHYDHLDLPTLRSLAGEVRMVVPEGHGRWMEKRGFPEVRELPWFGSAGLFEGLKVTATPAQHFTARTAFDRNRGHWCGYRIEGGGASLWHAGDSGWCPAFAEIGERLGGVDFGMIPIGAYSPRWFMKPVHLTPEEAVRVFRETRCRRAVGMHWGTFRLTDEPLGEPPRRLRDALREDERERFVTAPIGSRWSVGGEG
jgi:N-acyl-phosphatidylethanolamine-hydrolysing phospholipase D